MLGPKKALSLVAVAAGLTVTAAACASTPATSGKSSGAPRGGGVLVFARAADFRDFSGNDVESNFVWDQITEPLFRNAPSGHGVIPWLATSYTRSSNGLSWTFTLRKNVQFSNGQPLTSADVKFSLENTMKSNAWGFVDAAIKSISTPSADTVTITTKYPWAPLLSDLAIFANRIIPDNFAHETRAKFYQAPIGTGPFVWDYWHKGVDLRLNKNPHYWQHGKPYLNAIDFRVVSNDNTRMLQLQTGQANIIESPPPASISNLKSNPSLRVGVYPAFAVDYLSMNEKRAPFNDVNFRHAVDWAINRQAVVKAALFGYGRPANSMFMSNMMFYDPKTPGGEYAVARAKAALAHARVPKGYVMQLLYAPSSYYQTTAAQIIQQDLAAIGIQVKLVATEQNALYGLWFKTDFDTAILQWANDISDPDEWAEFALNPAQGSQSAFNSYNNPTVAKDVVQAGRALNDKTRASLYAQAQTIAAQQSNMALLDYPAYIYAMQKTVHGFYANPTAEYNLETVWLSK
jgi:peptide/nickel transport system substrate-binding protein